MFDIGFMELLLISIVALLVLGPEKLPHAIRTTALWIGRARRSFTKVKSEIEQQLNADEIRRQLHNESILKDLEEAKKKASELAKETGDSLTALSDEVSNTSALAHTDNQAEDEEQKTDSNTASADTEEVKPAPVEEKEQTIEEADDTKKTEKVTDFYNNPGSSVVTLKDGAFAAPEPPEADSDTGKKDND